jgi:hypothetical protein
MDFMPTWFPVWRIHVSMQILLAIQPNLKLLKIASQGSQWGITLVSSKKSKASTVLPGKVEKVIRPHPSSGEPEKAQIGVEGADHLYREIRVPNNLTDAEGHKVRLEEGAEVEVKIEADPSTTSAHPGESKASPRP